MPNGWKASRRDLDRVIILERYLAAAVIGGTLLTLAILLPLLGFFILADEIDALGGEGYGLAQAVVFTLLSLPRYAHQVFPIATLIGALVGLGALASRSELVAMRAAGFSIARILRAGLLGGLLLVVLAALVGEVIAPVAEQRGLELRRQALSGDVAQRTPYGFWAIDEGAYVNIGEIRSATRLRDISIYRIDRDKGELLATRAVGARFGEQGWMLEEIVQSRISAEGVSIERMDGALWDSMLDPGLLKVVLVDPQALPVWGLYKYIRFMTLNKQDAGPYEVAFWSKLIHPVLMLSMIFIAIPIILGSARTTGLGPRIFIGVLLGILYYLISRTFAFVSLLLGLDPLVAAAMPPVLFLAGALVLLRRVG